MSFFVKTAGLFFLVSLVVLPSQAQITTSEISVSPNVETTIHDDMTLEGQLSLKSTLLIDTPYYGELMFMVTLDKDESGEYFDLSQYFNDLILDMGVTALRVKAHIMATGVSTKAWSHTHAVEYSGLRLRTANCDPWQQSSSVWHPTHGQWPILTEVRLDDSSCAPRLFIKPNRADCNVSVHVRIYSTPQQLNE